MKKTITETVKKIILICDKCNKETSKVKKCYGCKKDLCASCEIGLDIDPFTQDNTGDYWYPICQDCNSILIPFTAKAAMLYKQYDEEVTKLEKEFKELCKK